MQASAEKATRFITALEASFEPALQFPLAGVPRAHFGPDIRVLFHHPYAIYYQPQPDAIVILRVIHGARDVATIAEQGGFNS